GSMVRIARSKHVFAVFDSCFAGTIFNASRARPPAAITRAVSAPVRQFLTSGDADQQVSDDGAFRRLFLKAIGGEENADANDDGYLTGTELSLFLEDRVVNLTQSLQTPRSGKLRDQRFDQGDFVFLLPQSAESQVAAVQPQGGSGTGTRALPAADPELAVELAFWDAIKASDSPDDYTAYLTAYPDGRFAVLAQSRRARLESGAAAREAEHERLEAEAQARSADEQHHRAEDEQHHQAEAARDAQLAALPPAAPQVNPEADPAAQEEEALGLTRGDRRELQAALTALGFDTRGIDGVFGPGTRTAIRGYQAAKGAERSGYLTASLAGSLRAEAPRAPAGETQTAARPAQAAISKSAAGDYLRANASAMKQELMEYNQQHRVIHGSYGGTAERLDIVSWRVEQVTGDEAVVAVAYREPIVVLAGNSGTQRFLLKWDGSGFSFVGHENGGAMRRTGG
ncbi:MAG: peptidoglycan-binding domain-containing protein, partial [Rhodovibrionaceae bacterium]